MTINSSGTGKKFFSPIQVKRLKRFVGASDPPQW